MAPEIIKHLPCSEKVDVWSYGVVLWELLLFEAPYMNTFERNKVIFGVGRGTLQLHVPETIPNGLKLLLQQCLNYKPRNRPSFSQIMKHLDVSYEKDSAILKNDALYMKLQRDDWKSTVQAFYDSLTKKIDFDQDQHQHREYDLIQRREEELQHAAHLREFQEERLRKVNNLYFELNTVLLQLEQREEAIAKKEEALNIKTAKQRIVKSLIHREFQQKANKMLNTLTKNSNQKTKSTGEQNKNVENINTNVVVSQMEPLENVSSNQDISSQDKNVNTSYDIPMSYDQAMQVEADKKSQQRRYSKQKSINSRRSKQQLDNGRRRATTSRLYMIDTDDYGFQADTEDNGEIRNSSGHCKRNVEKTIIDEQYRRKFNINRRSPYSNGYSDHEDDIDNDNIEDFIVKSNERPISTDYFDDETTVKMKRGCDRIENKTIELVVSENDDALTDDTRYAFEYDQKIENLANQQVDDRREVEEERMFDYLESSEVLENTKV